MSYFNVPVSVLPTSTPSLEVLEQYSEDPISEDDYSAQWSAYARLIGEKNSLNEERIRSLEYNLNLYFADTRLNEYKFENLSQNRLEAYFDGMADTVYSTFDKDGIKVATLLYFIIRTYEVNLSAFEVKSKLLNIRVSPSDLEALDRVEGKNRADKFRNLMSFYFDNI